MLAQAASGSSGATLTKGRLKPGGSNSQENPWLEVYGLVFKTWAPRGAEAHQATASA